MSALIDLTGQRFGKWMILRKADSDKNGNARWLCHCACDREKIVNGFALRDGTSRQCLHCARTTHGLTKTRLFNIWISIIQRCENPNFKYYKYYGGRGILICSKWRNDFTTFRQWALVNGYKKNLQIDRIDNRRGYEPNNCHFVTAKEQARNRRNNKYLRISNEVKLLVEWAEQTGIKEHILRWRINAGWPEHRLLESVRKRHRHDD